MRTDYGQTAWQHTPVCDALDALMDMVGEAQRVHAFGSPLFVALGRARMALCDAQSEAERECKFVGSGT